jgi:hypothetical protein
MNVIGKLVFLALLVLSASALVALALSALYGR